MSLLIGIYVFFSLFIVLLLRNRPFRASVPVNWPLLGMLPWLVANSHRIVDESYELLRELKGTFEFRGPWCSGMNFLLTSDPANSNHILNISTANYQKGDSFPEIFDVFGNGIFNSDGEWWRSQRKMAMALMASRKFQDLVTMTTMNKLKHGLIPLLNQMADRGETFDLSDVFLRFTLDTTCALSFGVDMGSLSQDLPIIPFAKAMDHVEQVLLFRHIVPGMWWKLLRRLRLGPEGRMSAALEVIDGFIALVIARRREETHANDDETPSDLLTSYMKMNLPAENVIHVDKFLRDTLLTFLAAGKDTTGVAIAWFFWLLSRNPNVEEKLLEELRGTSKKELGKLVYLHAAVCESLRLYPLVPFNHKEAVQTDLLPSGHRVERGATVLISMYAMGRMEFVWGGDCLEFKPERWISEGKLRHEPSYKFLAFNSGPRSCIGKDMAITQMKLVVAHTISNFHIQVAQGHEPEPKNSVVLGMEKGMKVLVKKRADCGLYGSN